MNARRPIDPPTPPGSAAAGQSSAMTRDKYDDEIDRLTADPGEIYDSWAEAGPLFQYATADGTREHGCGCLTQIKSHDRRAATDELTLAIRDDDRITDDPELLGVSDLPVFAEWQRRVDVELGR